MSLPPGEKPLSCMVMMFLGVTMQDVGGDTFHLVRDERCDTFHLVRDEDEAGCLAAYSAWDSTSQRVSSRVHQEAEKS